jgi:hypothetical protein
MDTERETRNYVSQLVNVIPDRELPLAQKFLEFLIEKSSCKETGGRPLLNAYAQFSKCQYKCRQVKEGVL